MKREVERAVRERWSSIGLLHAPVEGSVEGFVE